MAYRHFAFPVCDVCNSSALDCVYDRKFTQHCRHSGRFKEYWKCKANGNGMIICEKCVPAMRLVTRACGHTFEEVYELKPYMWVKE